MLYAGLLRFSPVTQHTPTDSLFEQLSNQWPKPNIFNNPAQLNSELATHTSVGIHSLICIHDHSCEHTLFAIWFLLLFWGVADAFMLKWLSCYIRQQLPVMLSQCS